MPKAALKGDHAWTRVQKVLHVRLRRVRPYTKTVAQRIGSGCSVLHAQRHRSSTLVSCHNLLLRASLHRSTLGLPAWKKSMMELPDFLREVAGSNVKCIEMHTTGEPTRIVYDGFPNLSGTLLEQRAKAQSQHDYIRQALICEPRGHREMYGAVLRPNTELVETGKADMGVLFLTNDGYSTMCGHATLAVARLLVDAAGCAGHDMLPGLESIRRSLPKDETTDQMSLRLHVPCGIVHVRVPVTYTNSGRRKADTSRPISYLSVPSFATGIDVSISIPQSLRWPELGNRETINVDVAYGGTFYVVASSSALGFSPSLATPDLVALGEATAKLKGAFNASAELRNQYLQHPDHSDLEFMYGTIVTDPALGVAAVDTLVAETGICFFANHQVDRSPTGSGVQARVALAYARGQMRLGEKRTYHSLVSNGYEDDGGFIGSAVEEVKIGSKDAVIVQVSGWARYTGCSNFIVEEDDKIGRGFWLDELGR